jgi:hypothetical protein
MFEIDGSTTAAMPTPISLPSAHALWRLVSNCP